MATRTQPRLTMLQPFDPNVKTKVLTDASLLHDIGFALVQVYKDILALIQCGSASLSPTQSRYSTVELECLAIMNAIQKCHYYLAGITRFEVWTDHRPLVGAFEKAPPPPTKPTPHADTRNNDAI